MSTEQTKKGWNPTAVFVISFCAAIVMAGGFAIILQAFVLAATNYLELGSTFLWVASGANALFMVWFGVWTFLRAWHVERRLRAGEDVDEPKMSIIETIRS